MNDDTISRQAAIEVADAVWVVTGDKNVAKVWQQIQDLPSAERHGHWEFIGGYGYQYRCSVCLTCAERKEKFCPNCGASMKGDTE